MKPSILAPDFIKTKILLTCALQKAQNILIWNKITTHLYFTPLQEIIQMREEEIRIRWSQFQDRHHWWAQLEFLWLRMKKKNLEGWQRWETQLYIRHENKRLVRNQTPPLCELHEDKEGLGVFTAEKSAQKNYLSKWNQLATEDVRWLNSNADFLIYFNAVFFSYFTILIRCNTFILYKMYFCIIEHYIKIHFFIKMLIFQ